MQDPAADWGILHRSLCLNRVFCPARTQPGRTTEYCAGAHYFISRFGSHRLIPGINVIRMRDASMHR